MSMLFRRSLLRAIPRSRGLATAAGDAAKSSYQEEQAALRLHAGGTHRSLFPRRFLSPYDPL